MKSCPVDPPVVRQRKPTMVLVGMALALLLTGLVATAFQGYFTLPSVVLCFAGIAAFAFAFAPRAGRNLSNWIESVIYSTFVIVAMGVFLSIVQNHPVTMDGTTSKLFSLSAESRQFLRDRLDRNVRITVFARETERASLGLLLSEYARFSPFVEYELKNPFADDLEARRFATNIIPGDAFVELLTTSSMQSERVVRLEKVTEETITNGIVQLLRGRTVNLYFLAGHGEPTLDSRRKVNTALGRRSLDDIEVLGAQLRKSHINVVPLALDQRNSVPVDASAVVIIAPQRDITQSEYEALRSYMDQGGRLMAFLEPEVALGGDLRPPLSLLNDLIENYGLSLPAETVILPGAQRGRRFRMETQPTEGHAITRLDQDVPLVFEQARPILSVTNLSASSIYEPLLLTEPGGWRVRNEVIARALLGGRDMDLKVDQRDLGKQPLAAAMTVLRPGQPMEKSTRLVVVGHAGFLGSDLLNQSGWLFFQNSVNWLTDSGDLIAIPSTTIENTPLTLSPGARHVLFILLVLVLPSVIGIGGTLLSLRRRGVL